MKITLFSSGGFFSSYGGGQIYVKSLADALSKRGHAISVVSITMVSSPENTGVSVTKTPRFPVWDIRLCAISLCSDRPIELQTPVVVSVRDVLRQIDPDLIHAHGWKSTATVVARQLGIPCVITAHHGGIVCPNGLLMNDSEQLCRLPVSDRNCLSCSLAFVPGGRFWRPLVKFVPSKARLSLASVLKRMRNIPYFSPAWQAPLGIEHKQMQINSMREANAIIAPSRTIADALRLNGFSCDQVKVIPHGIRLLERKPLLAGYPGRRLRLGYVGRISYIKGLHVLLDALQRLSVPQAVELHVYGEAATKQERKYQQRLLKEARGLNVTWHGKLSHECIGEAYLAVDILLLPSIFTEIFGLTLLEAMSAGRPVIATRSGGPDDIVTDGESGFLVPPNDAVALATAIERFIDEPGLLERLANNLVKVNSVNAHVGDLMTVYQSVCTGAAPGVDHG